MNIRVIRSVEVTDGEGQYCSKVGQMWHDIAPQADRIRGCAAAVYVCYRSENGHWTYRISSVCPDPSGEVSLQDGGAYQVYEGPKQGITGIYALWCRIWEDEKTGKIRRRRSRDYEWYRADGTVCIGISVFPPAEK